MSMKQNSVPNNGEKTVLLSMNIFQPEIHRIHILSDWHATPQSATPKELINIPLTDYTFSFYYVFYKILLSRS